MSKLIEGKNLGPFKLLPAIPGTCPECAVDHRPELPHNQQSLFFQYKFFGEHGRWPTWEDAMAHCTPDMQEFWKRELRALGVEI